MIRIYCDGNIGIDGERYRLNCHGSIADFDRHALELVDGMRVVLYMTDEVEGDGVIKFDRGADLWIGIPDRSSKRFIGRSAFEENSA